MKISTRVRLASAAIQGTVAVVLCLLGVLVHVGFIVVTLAWLWLGRRPTHHLLLPRLFRYITCFHCRARIELSGRFKCGSHWTDHRVRHALAVYCNHGHEIGTISCPTKGCGATIQLQKGNRRLLHDWTLVDHKSARISNERLQGGFAIGIDRSTLPSPLLRRLRKLVGLSVGRPIYVPKPLLRQHGFILGKTGAGKSIKLIGRAVEHMQVGDGLGVIDPAGDLSEEILKRVPQDRVDDVIYLNAGDFEHPFPFNICQTTEVDDKALLPYDLIGVFQQLYASAWGKHLAELTRSGVQVVQSCEGSLLDLYKLFYSGESRLEVLVRVRDEELVRHWQEKPFTAAQRSSMLTMLAPIVEHPYLSPILCSRTCMLDGREIIRNRRILIVNLATGTRADQVTTILGTFVVNKIVSAIYRQGRMSESRRVPFYLLVDEFQNFMHRSFNWKKGLSEVRKFGLGLLFVTQYLEGVDSEIRKAILGNIAYLACFKVGSDDAVTLQKEFTNSVTTRALTTQQRGECMVEVDNSTWSMRTLFPEPPQDDPTEVIRLKNRQRIAAYRAQEQDVSTETHQFTTTAEERIAQEQTPRAAPILEYVT